MTKAVDEKLAAGLAKARAKLGTLVDIIDENGTYSPASGGLTGETMGTYPNVEVMGWAPVREKYIEAGTALATDTECIVDAAVLPFGPINVKDMLSDRVSLLVVLGADTWRVIHVEAYQGADDVAAYLFVMAQA